MATVKSDAAVGPLKGGLKGQVLAKFASGDSIKKGFIADKFTFVSLIACFLFLFLQCALIAFYWKRLPPEIPIFYSMPWGGQMLGKTAFIWVIPFIDLIITLLNLALVVTFVKENKFLTKILVSSTLIVGFVTFYSVAKTITLLS